MEQKQILDMILKIGREITEIDYNIKEDNDTFLERIQTQLKECTNRSDALKKLIDIWYERSAKVKAKLEEEDELWDEIFYVLEDYYKEETQDG